MRRKLMIGLVLLNGALGTVLLGTEPAESRIWKATLRNCCMMEGGEPICCEMCCWIQPDCSTDADCKAP